MTVRELIDRPFAQIQNGELRGSDPVPADLLDDEHLDAAEYLGEKIWDKEWCGWTRAY